MLDKRLAAVRGSAGAQERSMLFQPLHGSKRALEALEADLRELRMAVFEHWETANM